MPTSKSRQAEIAKAAMQLGYKGAAEQLGIAKETVRRQCRAYKGSAGKPVAVPPTAPPAKGARILLFDIETTPIQGYFWRTRDEFIYPEQIIEDTKVLCWAATWLGSDGMLFRRGKNWRDDKALVQELADLLGQADVVVAHNGKAFDVGQVWARLAYHGIQPPAPFKVADTCILARRVFNFPHNSLQGLARYLEIGSKVEHEGFPLWKKCMANDKEAWERMELYNIADVELLEQVYMRLRPYDKRHPNLALYWEDGDLRCVRCGKASLKESTKAAYTGVSVFPMFQCESCGAWMRSGKRDKREPVKRSVL